METTIETEGELAALAALVDEVDAVHEALGARAEIVTAQSAWSPRQHLYHATLAAELALANVQALLAGTSSRIVHEGAPNDTARRVFRDGGYPRGQSQAPRMVVPPERPEASLLAAELERARARLTELAPRAAEIADARGRILHPLLGVLSAAEWLRFARLHTAHHVAIVRDLARD